MPKESNLSLKVGLFVVVAFILGGVLIFSVSDIATLEKGRNLQVVFGFANGLRKAAPVRFAGVECGIVKNVEVFFDSKESKPKVKVDFWIKDGTLIPVDSTAAINQLGLLGEKYLEIVPGVSLQQLTAGLTLQSKDPIAVEKLSELVSQLAVKIEKSVDGFNGVVNNEKNQKSIETTLEGLSVIVTQVKEGQGTIGKLFFDPSLFNNLEEFTLDLKANPWKLLYRPKVKQTNPK